LYVRRKEKAQLAAKHDPAVGRVRRAKGGERTRIGGPSDSEGPDVHRYNSHT